RHEVLGFVIFAAVLALVGSTDRLLVYLFAPSPRPVPWWEDPPPRAPEPRPAATAAPPPRGRRPALGGGAGPYPAPGRPPAWPPPPPRPAPWKAWSRTPCRLAGNRGSARPLGPRRGTPAATSAKCPRYGRTAGRRTRPGSGWITRSRGGTT